MINASSFVAETGGTALLATGVLLASFLPSMLVPPAIATALLVAILLAAPYSGAHLNPAVTAALFGVGKIEALPALGYVAAQLVGAVLVATVARTITHNVKKG